MTDRPILFSAPMIRALIDGRKTQTRRIIKAGGQIPEFCGAGPRGGIDWHDPRCWGWHDHEHGDWITVERDPASRISWRDWRGAWQPGDRLWVRETHAYAPLDPPPVIYKATVAEDGWEVGIGARWRPSIHMPRWASRLTLLVTDVRVQRLQHIDGLDALAEGVDRLEGQAPWRTFKRVWNSIHGPDAWDNNPWVAAISFQVHRRNIDEMERNHD